MNEELFQASGFNLQVPVAGPTDWDYGPYKDWPEQQRELARSLSCLIRKLKAGAGASLNRAHTDTSLSPQITTISLSANEYPLAN